MPLTQANRQLRVKSPLGDDVLLLESFSGFEQMSRPFRFVLHVLSENPSIAMQDLLYKPVVLSISMNEGVERHVHGNVSRLKHLAMGEDGLAGYEVEIAPWLWFLNQFSDCRIFQNKTVPQILQKVFADRGYSDYRVSLNGTYPQREYCVQYRETDFNFVSRLMEEEGIFYYFEHSQDKHVLVLLDKKESLVDSKFEPSVRFAASTGGRVEADTVSAFEMEINLYPGKATLTDYDFEKPSTDLSSTLSGALQGEYYDYPGKYKTRDDGDRLTRIRLEEAEMRLVTVRGQSNVKGFESGYKFTLKDHYRDDFNQQYTITGMHQKGRNPSYRSDASAEGFEYQNFIEAIPASVPFRPARITRKPAIEGTQTAVVVGKSGEEIWTDKYGRVKVQFYWDREGKADENSSCWMRVAQSTAGKGWGAMSLPRIGHEVIVDFLEGDPDRPIITGRVYNAEQIPPYALPDQQNVTTMKSLSTKGGGGFNEIRLDDTKSTEQIFIHAQYNMDTRVKNNDYKTVEKDMHVTVNQDRFEHVKNDFHITVDRDHVQKYGRDHGLDITGKQAIKVTGSHTLQVTGDVAEKFSGSHSEDTSMNIFLKGGMGIVLEAGTGITLKCGGSSVVLDASGVTITGMTVTIDGSAATKINSGPGSPPTPGTPCSAVSPDAPKEAKDAADSESGKVSEAQYHARSVGSAHLDEISPSPHKSPTPAYLAGNGSSPEDPQKKKTWIEIKLVDEEGNPVPGEKYKVTLADGTVAEGTLDGDGKARVDGIDPGSAQVTFPRLDKSVWSSK